MSQQHPDDKAHFEVHCGDKVFRIWADGRTEGFEDQPEPRVVINRIPLLLAEAIRRGWA